MIQELQGFGRKNSLGRYLTMPMLKAPPTPIGVYTGVALRKYIFG
jgi:hypothetical protein